jgi:hypothetical protein
VLATSNIRAVNVSKLTDVLEVTFGKFTDVSGVFCTSIIALMMEGASTSATSMNYKIHGATTQKTVVFILVILRTPNLPSVICFKKTVLTEHF